MKKDETAMPGAPEGERSSTGAAPEVKRWSATARRKLCCASCVANRWMPFPENLIDFVCKFESFNSACVQRTPLDSFFAAEKSLNLSTT